MRLLRTLPLCLCVAFLLSGLQAPAQRPASSPRILEKIDANQLVTLTGNTHPAANLRNDLGRVNDGLPMTDLILVLSRGSEQQAAFDAFVAGQYDASSPNYHHWLMPAEVGEQFGPALSDVATITNWLSSRGFTVNEVSKDRMTIRFSGNAAQVQSAFHTEIHNLSVRGEHHIANMSDPQIPAALAPVVAGIKALHDFRPRPQHHLGGFASLNRDTGAWTRTFNAAPKARADAAFAGSKPLPQFGVTTGSGSTAVQIEDVAPYDFATIYNVLPLWNAATPINGKNQTIAVTGTSDINLTDVSTFRSSFGLPAGLAPEQVQGANGLDPGICTSTTAATCNLDDLVENTLDVEWSGAVAPGAQVVLVTSGAKSATDDTVYDSSSYVVENLGNSASPVANAHILNVSYGACELGEGTSGNAVYNNLWQTASAEGIAVFVASGDAGSAACDQGFDATLPYEAQFGLSVSGIASTPYDTAVGGTDLNWGTAAAPYWNATNNTTNGASAVGYVPEVPWNDTCANPFTLSFLQTQVAPALVQQGFKPASPTDAETSCQFIITWYQQVQTTFGVDLSPFVDVVGGGGGVSACTTSDGQTAASCTGGYAKPSWQASVQGIPADGKRDLPDVSFFASNGFLGSAYLVCVSEAGSSCTYSATTENQFQEIGGTSVASPAMAGVMAMINQKAGAPQGNPNAELYTLAAAQTYSTCSAETVKTSSSCYFNDIDANTGSGALNGPYAGTIAVPCQIGTANCAAAADPGDTVAILPGYSSATGYDQATGLGSLNVANVVNAWPTPTVAPGTPTVTVTPSLTSFSVTQPITVTVTVAGSGATPTGTVTLVGPGFLGGAQTLVSGSFPFTIPAGGLYGGTDQLTATYGGDTNYISATGSATVTVTKIASAVSEALGATSITANVALIVNGTVTGAGPTPTGYVTVSGGGYTSPASGLTAGAYSVTIPASSLAVGTDALTVTYSGDGNYTSSTNSANVTVAAAPPATYALSASTTTAVAPGKTATSTITATGANGYAGSVMLTCSLNTGGPTNQSGDAPSCTVGTPNPIVLSTSTTTGTVTVSVSTTAATTGALIRPDLGRHNSMTLAGLGAAGLALLTLLGIPARRRSLRAFLGMLALVFALGSLAACGGGGGGNSGGGGTSNPGTAAGAYTFTITGAGSDTAKTAATTPFTVTVN
ncbi:MAG: protease pro-enzyme activation domain-containing protein [Terracidiphilus sp.]